MTQIRVQRDQLAVMLRLHGEDDLADRATSLTDEQLKRIGILGAYYAWSEDAFALGFGMGGARAVALAAVDVLEGNGRPLRRHHPESNVAAGWPETPDADERSRESALRRQAAEKQLHSL